MTFVEVITVLTVISVLIVVATPSFTRTIEQAHADIAGANLHAVWSAQRCYWLEHREYAHKLDDLAEMDLLDRSIMDGTSRYTFRMKKADKDSFEAEAKRWNSNRWRGTFVIDETGEISGVVRADGEPAIEPAAY
jgi:type IV pilus assembly protein PilE